MKPTSSPCLFTIGHSNQKVDEFITLLKSHHIQVLADVRTHPYSRFVTHFNREALQADLKGAGIPYLFLGEHLGGRPQGEAFYDDAGHVLYNRVAEAPFFLEGITRLEDGIRRYRVAIMCSEEDPAVCHRHLLVSRVMAGRGARVQHIRGDGRLQLFEDLQPSFRQGTLFDLSEEPPWKSLRSVLPRNPPSSSSGSSDDMEFED